MQMSKYRRVVKYVHLQSYKRKKIKEDFYERIWIVFWNTLSKKISVIYLSGKKEK